MSPSPGPDSTKWTRSAAQDRPSSSTTARWRSSSTTIAATTPFCAPNAPLLQQPASRMLGRLSAPAVAVAATQTDDVPILVAGGQFGLEVWEIRSARRLAFHPWKVNALTI